MENKIIVNGKAVKKYFEKQGYHSYSQMATAVGVSKPTMHHLVTKNKCGINLAFLICKFNIDGFLKHNGKEVFIGTCDNF